MEKEVQIIDSVTGQIEDPAAQASTLVKLVLALMTKMGTNRFVLRESNFADAQGHFFTLDQEVHQGEVVLVLNKYPMPPSRTPVA